MMAGLKLWLSLSALLVSATVAYKSEPPACEEIEDHFRMFPGVDPRTFYVCLPTGDAQLVQCESGRVFVDNDEVYGCAPFELSPCAKKYRQIDCSPGADRSTLVQALDPSTYWLCSAPSGTPVELPCPEGKGFVKNATVMGCLPWADWTC